MLSRSPGHRLGEQLDARLAAFGEPEDAQVAHGQLGQIGVEGVLQFGGRQLPGARRLPERELGQSRGGAPRHGGGTGGAEGAREALAGRQRVVAGLGEPPLGQAQLRARLEQRGQMDRFTAAGVIDDRQRGLGPLELAHLDVAQRHHAVGAAHVAQPARRRRVEARLRVGRGLR